ncbi:MAG: Ig-like domain-containing protein [Clostridia bacterium]|nr:Ig-like domain-containing protein [Clostridia bacterium]
MSEANKIFIRAAAESNVGNARGNNEDNVYFNGDYITPRNISRPFAIKTGEYTDVNIFAVFDGMGRNNTGSFASLVAATRLDALADRISFDPDVTPDDAVLEYMQDTNELIRDQRRETGGVRTASTMALLIIEHGNAHVYNVGDSRVYLYRDKQLVKLTRDHVAVEGQKSVALTEEGIRHGRITKFLGMNSREGKMEPYRAKPFKVKKGDKFLVCSDGVTDQLDEDELTVCLGKRKDPFGHTNEIMALSMSDDSDDNVSAIVVEAVEPGIHITQNMIMVAMGCLIMAFGVAVGFVFGWLVGSTSSEYEGLEDFNNDNYIVQPKVSDSDVSSDTENVSMVSSAIPTTVPNKDKTSSEEVQYTVYGLTLRQNNDITLKRGKTVTLSVEINPDNVPQSYVQWSSDDEKVATVDQNGKVKALKHGQATITASAGNVTVTCLIRVP